MDFVLVRGVSPLLRRWRVGVFGGSTVGTEVADLSAALGRRLAREPDIVLVTGGFRCWRSEGKPSIDWSTAEAFATAIGDLVDGRVETILPDPAHDDDNIERFELGAVRRLSARGRQQRRFVLVDRTDALVGLAGDTATREMIDLAIAIDRPCLLVPFTGGAAEQRWRGERGTIATWFQLTEPELAWLSGPMPTGAADIESSVERIVAILRRRLGRKCFVMMAYQREATEAQYREAIEPALHAHGCIPVRADKLAQVGDAVAGLRNAIQVCDFAVALLDELTPNVAYEIGFAQALGKPVIFVATRDPEALKLPFDFRNEQLCGVQTRGDLDKLRTEIARFLPSG